MLKKAALVFMLLVIPISLPAVQVEVGALFGLRTVVDSEVKDIYGNGTVFFPYLKVEMWEGLYFGAGYEGGYERSGTIGIFEEKTSLKVTGIEIFAGYRARFRNVVPYLHVGLGIYSYKQTVDSPYAEGYEVDHRKNSPFLGGGIKFYLSENVFMSGEVKYVPLKVKPFEEEVDLSGLRILGGLGFSF